MPMYQTQCPQCSKQEPKKLSFQEYDLVKQGCSCLTCSCGGVPQLMFDPSDVNFVLKDGESGGWVSKSQRENKYRAARSRTMDRRTRDHVKPNKLIPNYNGQVASSWKEVQDTAYQSTYAKVNSEHGSRDAAKAAKESARTYERHVKQEAS